MNIDKLLEKVPDFEYFYDTETLFRHAKEKAEKNPDFCKLTYIGKSKAGEDIPMVSVGDGEVSILLFASPHPNEPIGAMMNYFLLDELTENPELRKGRTWHIIPCIDPDGTRYNEGWFKGPFTLKNYSRHFYRPKGSDQAEWTFPITYKNFTFDKPIPETKALMDAINRTKPRIMYSLHNAGFGGAYYYISEPLEGAYKDFHRLPLERDLPLSLGEPEMPYCVEFHPAVYKSTSVTEAYDYFEKYGKGDPAQQMFGGASSYDFSRTVSSPFCLIAEVPYFKTDKIKDKSEIVKTRRDVLLEGISRARDFLTFAGDIIKKTKPFIKEGGIFRDASSEFVELLLSNLPSMEAWAGSGEGMDAKATVAQEADSIQIRLFYNMLIVSMYRRAMNMQLAKEENPVLREAYKTLDIKLDSLADEIGEALEYGTVKIRDMIQIQYGALLAVLKAKNL